MVRIGVMVGVVVMLGACAERSADDLALEIGHSDPRLAAILEGNHPHWGNDRLATSSNDIRLQVPSVATEALTVRRGTHALSLRATSAEGEFVEAAGRLTLNRAQDDVDFVIAPWCERDRADCAVEGVEWALIVRRPRAVLRASWKITLGELTPRMTSREGDVLFVDSAGTPHFRIPRPYAIDSAGERREGFVAVEGNSLIVQVDTHGLSFPIVVDPSIENAVWVDALPTPPSGMAFDDTQRGHVLVLDTDGNTWEWNAPVWTRLPASPPIGNPSNSSGIGGAQLVVAWDSARARAVAFGSVATSFSGNDTWEWTGSAWVSVSPSVRPSPRTQMAMTYDAARGETVLFGGWEDPAVGETWIWDGTNWTLRTPAVSPNSRFGVQMAFDAARSRVVLFGGWVWTSTGFLASGDTWEWDGTTWHLAGTGPARDGLMVFDGTEGAVVLVSPTGQTVKWDGSTWNPITTVNQPPQRFGFAAFDSTRQRMVFGARQTWESSSRIWEQVPLRPTPRFRHGSAWDPVNHATLIFGGLALTNSGLLQSLDDTWLWNGSQWLPRSSPLRPSPRSRPGIATDLQRRRVVLFGGENDSATKLGDTWEWDGVSWTEVTPLVGPGPRVAPAMGWDAQRRVVVMFGGGSNVLLNDTWTWDGTAWTKMTPAHVPAARHGHSMAWSNAEQFLLMAGGDPVADSWTWTGADWMPASGRVPAYSGLASTDRGPLAYSVLGGSVEYFDGGWRNQTLNGPTPGRAYAGLVGDPLRHRVVATCGEAAVASEIVPLDGVWEWVARGNTCSSADECGTGFCVDGVCCDSACGNGDLFDCLACSRERGAPSDGTCAPVGCKAGGSCVTATCDVSTGTCTSSPTPDGVSCDDANECTQTDVCVAGRCAGTPIPSGICENRFGCGLGYCSNGYCVQIGAMLDLYAGRPCDDHDPCSVRDSCTDAGACVGTAAPDGTGCDDQQFCTDSDSCQAGACLGVPHVCSPGTCATAACSEQDGRCSYRVVPDGASCADTNACTTQESCWAGVCATVPLNCPAPNECQRGVCSPTNGCENAPVADGLTCDGGLCRSGVCQPQREDAGAPDAGESQPADAGLGTPGRTVGCHCAAVDPAFVAGLLLFARHRVALRRRPRRE